MKNLKQKIYIVFLGEKKYIVCTFILNGFNFTYNFVFTFYISFNFNISMNMLSIKGIHKFCLIFDGGDNTNLRLSHKKSSNQGCYKSTKGLTLIVQSLINSYMFFDASICLVILFTILNASNEWCLLLT